MGYYYPGLATTSPWVKPWYYLVFGLLLPLAGLRRRGAVGAPLPKPAD